MARPDKAELEKRFATTWQRVMCLEGRDARESAIFELTEHFKVPRDRAEHLMREAEKELVAEFENRGLDPSRQEQLTKFYDDQNLEAFELMSYHVERGDEVRGALKYVVALEVARRRPGRRYLDVGSGVGSGAILFGQAGFAPTLSDIASPLLAFARTRLERRGIQATYVDMKTGEVPDASQDFITCFDVLEHMTEPLELLAWCRRKLAPGGLLAVFAAFGEDDHNPLHVVHDRALHRKFRSAGFEEDATASRFAYEMGLRKLYFFTPKDRSPLAASWVRVMDSWTPTWLRGLKLRLRGERLAVS